VGRSFPGGSSSYPSEDYFGPFSVLLRVEEVSRGRRPFKFENMWLEADGLDDLIKSVWDERNVIGPRVLFWERNSFF